ncbi:hypothetical protein IscW_ISCW006268 [Ixodes scapularis]|uniref:Uncharacterized protein n=1 Tax=Ixodes scapularis TaxID=6945 RepID=B7PKG6_IXOSC|nr:hypothetical protein IscW_ISCW006268 [Ixodes scapularis]|eukprot:XP_002399958.1 hypothetical protein IscW_ISCW006268 [Ixodes scapularis]
MDWASSRTLVPAYHFKGRPSCGAASMAAGMASGTLRWGPLSPQHLQIPTRSVKVLPSLKFLRAKVEIQSKILQRL